MAETERNHGGYNPNSQEHWFPPGTSGNPSGRKKGTVYVAEWMKMLSESKRRELEAIALDEDALSVMAPGQFCEWMPHRYVSDGRSPHAKAGP